MDFVKKVTITDVAKKAGCSTGTVSAVINGKASVRTSTRERILAVTKELNYRPAGHAKSLKTKNTLKSIGLVIRALENPFYIEIATGVKQYANLKGYLVFISSSEGIHKSEENTVEFLLSKDIGGAIIAPVIDGCSEIEHLFRLKKMNFPFVLLEEVKGIQTNVVSIDNVTATKQMVKYLVDSGYEQIIHFSGPEYATHTHERIDGFRRAFSESKLIYNESLIISVGERFRDGFKNGLEYFKDASKLHFPLAVVCYNDWVALGLLSALSQLKIKVPDKVAIVGNDNIEFSKHSTVPLTTISSPLKKLGYTAAEILINHIEAVTPNLPTISNVTLDTKIIVRDSTRILK